MRQSQLTDPPHSHPVPYSSYTCFSASDMPDFFHRCSRSTAASSAPFETQPRYPPPPPSPSHSPRRRIDHPGTCVSARRAPFHFALSENLGIDPQPIAGGDLFALLLGEADALQPLFTLPRSEGRVSQRGSEIGSAFAAEPAP